MRAIIALLLIVFFLAVITAVAIPQLRESYRAAREAAAATALKSGILPAEVEFQAGAYLDQDHNGLGEYATCTGLGPGRSYPMLAGAITTPGGRTLNLLAPPFREAFPVIGGYRFGDPVSEISSQERVWGVIAQPLNAEQGRRVFAISQAGNLMVRDANACCADPKATDADFFGVSLVTISPNAKGWNIRR